MATLLGEFLVDCLSPDMHYHCVTHSTPLHAFASLSQNAGFYVAASVKFVNVEQVRVFT